MPESRGWPCGSGIKLMASAQGQILRVGINLMPDSKSWLCGNGIKLMASAQGQILKVGIKLMPTFRGWHQITQGQNFLNNFTRNHYFADQKNVACFSRPRLQEKLRPTPLKFLEKVLEGSFSRTLQGGDCGAFSAQKRPGKAYFKKKKFWACAPCCALCNKLNGAKIGRRDQKL
jgi:hypothetical protein